MSQDIGDGLHQTVGVCGRSCETREPTSQSSGEFGIGVAGGVLPSGVLVVPVWSGLPPRAECPTCAHPDDMSTKDAMGTRRLGRQEGLWRARRSVIVMLLTALAVAGCSGSEARPRSGSPAPTSPIHKADKPVSQPMSQHRLDKLVGFLDKTTFLDRVGPKFELREVQYTSPTDAVAQFLDHRPASDDWGLVIATTDDNWAHASRLLISWDLADLVDYLPLGHGAVAIKAKDQVPRMKSYPPFVLYPNGEVKPLRVTEARALDADSEFLRTKRYDFLWAIGADDEPGPWAADIDDGEIFPVTGSPSGQVVKHVPGRDGAVLSVAGYRKDVGDGVWRFETSTDAGLSWRRTEVSLPLGRQSIWRVSVHTVGPGHLQAIAMADSLPDMPLHLRELWLTDDEKEFRRVPLPWEGMAFGGMAFASDGALLLAEVQGPDTYCDSLVCNRPGRIWRLAPGGTELRLLSDAPRLFGSFRDVGIQFSGGAIVARTGLRTIALSEDGYTWTEVTPG